MGLEFELQDWDLSLGDGMSILKEGQGGGRTEEEKEKKEKFALCVKA